MVEAILTLWPVWMYLNTCAVAGFLMGYGAVELVSGRMFGGD